MSGITEPPYANARAFVMLTASAWGKRALSIGAITSQAPSIIDSCARTEYADAGRTRQSSAPSRISVAVLDRRVVQRGVGLSRKRSRTLRQILCNDDAAF